jgi:hypothetical protein
MQQMISSGWPKDALGFARETKISGLAFTLNGGVRWCTISRFILFASIPSRLREFSNRAVNGQRWF